MSRSLAAFASHRGHLSACTHEEQEANQDPLQQNIKSNNKETRVCIGKQIKIHCNRISNQATRRLEFALGSKPHLTTDELTAQICSCTRKKKARMSRHGGCLARVLQEEEERSPGAWSPSPAAAWLPSSAGVVRRRCSMEEEERKGEGDRGFVNLRRRIKPIARMTARPIAPMRLAAHSPLAPPFSTSARE
jgi:hypothetical protein